MGKYNVNNKVNINCLVCGNNFTIVSSRLGRAKYCSWECRNRGISVGLLDNKRCTGRIPWNKDLKYNEKMLDKLNMDGLKVGHEIMRNTSGIPRPRGELCPAWKGGKTTKRLKILGQIEYKNWRTKCFCRDNYTCQNCGSKSGKLYDGTIELEVHHRIPVRKLLDTKFERYIYDINNGITLCAPCHRLIPTR